MTDLESSLAQTFGSAAPFSDYAIGDTIRFRDRHSGQTYEGEIFWIAEAGAPGLSGNESLPMRYIVKRAGWSEDSFPDIVYQGEILTQEPDELVLVKCKFCTGHHYRGQEMYCPFNPHRERQKE